MIEDGSRQTLSTVGTLELESRSNIDQLGIDPGPVDFQEYRPLVGEVGVESARRISGGFRDPVGVGAVKAVRIEDLGCGFDEQAPALLGIASPARFPGQCCSGHIVSRGLSSFAADSLAFSVMRRIPEESSSFAGAAASLSPSHGEKIPLLILI